MEAEVAGFAKTPLRFPHAPEDSNGRALLQLDAGEQSRVSSEEAPEQSVAWKHRAGEQSPALFLLHYTFSPCQVPV